MRKDGIAQLACDCEVEIKIINFGKGAMVMVDGRIAAVVRIEDDLLEFIDVLNATPKEMKTDNGGISDTAQSWQAGYLKGIERGVARSLVELESWIKVEVDFLDNRIEKTTDKDKQLNAYLEKKGHEKVLKYIKQKLNEEN